jgi:hypothetical protein
MWEVFNKIIMKYFLISLMLFLSACSIKTYEQTQAKILIIKSPLIKFADLAYIRHSGSAIELELFVAGKAIKTIAINHLICVDEGCMSKAAFNEEYLSGAYPSDILQNILLHKAIYNAKNRIQTDNGFSQEIQTQDVDIYYKVTDSKTYFKDKKNRIMIKIKDTNS